MPEILTESFCERCGTRYTFESTAPRKARRLGQFKTLSKGLKNYVLSDDTSMDEAMAAARGDQEREATAQQLDAFHSTFNFCMNCRQYTCGNCWNHVEGRCLTCSPNLGHDILQAPFPNDAPFEPVPISAEAWPTADLPAFEDVTPAYGTNGNGAAAEHAPAEDLAVEAVAEVAEAQAAATEALVADEPAAEAAPAEDPWAAAAPVAPEDVVAESSSGTVPQPEAIEDDDPGATFSFLRLGRTEPEIRVEAPAATNEPPAEVATPLAATVDETADRDEAPIEDIAAAAAASPLPDELDDRVTELTSHTSDLLGRFRPGQNIDAELAAFEASVAAEAEPATEPTAPPAWPEPDPEVVAAAWPEPEPETIVVAQADEPLEVEPESVALAPEPEPVGAEPAPVAVEPEPIAAEQEPEPVAAEPEVPSIAATGEPVRTDRIEQPTWRIYAPDQIPAAPQPVEMPVVPAPPSAAPGQPVAMGEPQWPARPDVPESPSMALLANRNRSSSDALWAASTAEVLSPIVDGPATPIATVQPCSSCGLSLSANARFCRRCGTRQG